MSARSPRRSRAVRVIGLTTVVMGVGLLVSASSPEEADADIPVLGPALGLGGKALGWFGGQVTHAAGSVVLDGVKAILDWIFGGLRDTITPYVMKFLTRVDLVFGGGLERMVVPLVVIGAALMVLGRCRRSSRATALSSPARRARRA